MWLHPHQRCRSFELNSGDEEWWPTSNCAVTYAMDDGEEEPCIENDKLYDWYYDIKKCYSLVDYDMKQCDYVENEIYKVQAVRWQDDLIVLGSG